MNLAKNIFNQKISYIQSRLPVKLNINTKKSTDDTENAVNFQSVLDQKISESSSDSAENIDTTSQNNNTSNAYTNNTYTNNTYTNNTYTNNINTNSINTSLVKALFKAQYANDFNTASSIGTTDLMQLMPYSSINNEGISQRDYIIKVVEAASSKYNVSSSLIKAVIEAESSYNPNAVSSAGAKGLMQLMPCNIGSRGVNDPFDIVENINAGTSLLSELLNKYDGDLTLTLAAYNAGSGNVRKYGGAPPFTQGYISKVLKYMEKYETAVG